MKVNSIFNAIKLGVLLCNQDGCIIFFNQAYGDFIGCRLCDVKGQHISAVRPGARLIEVLKNKRSLENILRTENGQEYFASIYPVLDGQDLKGSISLVTTIGQIRDTRKDSLTLHEKTQEFEKQEILRTVAIYGNTLEGKKKAANDLGISLATLYNKLSV